MLIPLNRLGLGLWCLTPLSTIFQLYRFNGGGNRSSQTLGKSLKTYLKNVFRVHLAMSGIRTHNFNSDRHWLHR